MMPYILSIDTALATAGICLSEGATVIDTRSNHHQAEHSTWVHAAIREMMETAGLKLPALDAVAVASGPGSYTGLRVGMATAKGICYALGIPLITETTLMLQASYTREQTSLGDQQTAFICPMIDARRMEVFTALYDQTLREVRPPWALVLEESSFQEEIQDSLIFFSGNGSMKWKEKCQLPQASFVEGTYEVTRLAAMAAAKFDKSDFTPLAYSEPVYIKSFYTGSS